MARTRDIAALKEIAELRAAQQTATGLQASIAGAELRDLEALADRTETQLEIGQTAWAQAIRRAPLRLELVQTWSTLMLQKEEELRSIGFHVDEAKTNLSRKTEAWKDAKARQDCAEAVSKAAIRRRKRQQEEFAVGVAADAFLHRRGRP